MNEDEFGVNFTYNLNEYTNENIKQKFKEVKKEDNIEKFKT